MRWTYTRKTNWRVVSRCRVKSAMLQKVCMSMWVSRAIRKYPGNDVVGQRHSELRTGTWLRGTRAVHLRRFSASAFRRLVHIIAHGEERDKRVPGAEAPELLGQEEEAVWDVFDVEAFGDQGLQILGHAVTAAVGVCAERALAVCVGAFPGYYQGVLVRSDSRVAQRQT